MSGISISKVEWGEHHSFITTDTAANMLDAFLFLSQFKVLPTTLAGLRESARFAVAGTMTRDQLRKACEEFRENNPETVLFEKKEEGIKE